MQNFYHLGDFFVVDKIVMDFFAKRFPEEIDIAPVKMLHDDGSPSGSPYFAVVVLKTLECVDVANSFVGHKPATSFSETITEYELSEELAHEFANKNDNKYVSFPRLYHQISQVKLFYDNIPRDAAFFRPLYWPGYYLCSPDFDEALRRMCSGGTPGYYYWTLDLSDLTESHGKLLQALR